MSQCDIAAFDEAVFPPLPAQADAYWATVSRGYARMENASVMIAGLARNIADVLDVTRQRIECLGKYFKRYRVAIYENDSSDGTAERLKQWARVNPYVEIKTTSLGAPINLPERCLKRAERMAYYRAELQAMVNQHPSDAFEYVILVDTDLHGGWSIDGVANTFGQRTAWDFVGSYGIIYKRLGLSPNRLVHYDAWAYRCDEQYTPLTAKDLNRLLFERGEAMVPVYSCFGGLGIYTQEAYRAGVYDGHDIEHVGFHRSLRQKGYNRIFLNPNQITVYGRKHRKMDRIAAQFGRWLSVFGQGLSEPWQFAEPFASPGTQRRLSAAANDAAGTRRAA